jgi:hypothetical protein
MDKRACERIVLPRWHLQHLILYLSRIFCYNMISYFGALSASDSVQ